jgi:hypothetical protein
MLLKLSKEGCYGGSKMMLLKLSKQGVWGE